MSTEQHADAAPSVGGRIRAVREQRGLSVRALASRAGLSTALISQVERDITDPSMQTLRAIAKVLETPLFDFFAAPDAADVAVVRADARMSLRSPRGDLTYTRLSPGSGRIEVLEGVLQPGGSSSDEPWSHPSEECVIVAEGELVVEVRSQSHVLGPGDSCYFDSRLPHRYRNESAGRTRFTLAITPPSY